VGIADRRERAGRGAGVASPRRFIIREKTHERPKKIGEANRQTGCENGIHDQLSTIQHLRKLADWTRVKVLFDPCSTSQVVQTFFIHDARRGQGESQDRFRHRGGSD
jgi:hypothetical protein